MWERINHYHLWLHSDLARDLYDQNRNDFYCQIKRINQLILGICEGTMSHDETWDFYLLGKYLERSSQTAHPRCEVPHLAPHPRTHRDADRQRATGWRS